MTKQKKREWKPLEQVSIKTAAGEKKLPALKNGRVRLIGCGPDVKPETAAWIYDYADLLDISVGRAVDIAVDFHRMHENQCLK